MKIVIVGIGKVGRALAEHLSKEGHDVAVIDNRPGIAERLAEELDVLGIEGNGAAYTVQQQARAGQADLVIAATDGDEVNMIACMTAKKLGAKNTIARVRSAEYEGQLRFMQQEMGLSLSINPERETARDIARILRFPAVAKVETFAKGRVELVEYHIPQDSLLDGMPLKEIAASMQVKVLVCAVRRGEEIIIPDGNYVLGAGDCISVTAKPQELENFFRALGVFRDHARNVMIVGAGRITRYLAEQLSQMKMRVRVVDRDEQRCIDMSEAVPTTLVIHGDATDVHLLAEEGLDDSDAFVALTGLDELNIMLAMYARCHNIDCSVAKVNRNSFTELIQKTAIVESTVSTSVVTVSRILQYVRALENSTGGGVIALHRIVENRVEALEFRVTQSTRYLGVALKDMPLKPNLLVALISRRDKVLVPSGSDYFAVDDTVVIVTKSDRSFNALNDIFGGGQK